MDAELQRCLESRDRAVRFYRLGMEALGSEGLVAFVDALMQVLPESPELDISRTNAVLQEILQAQARNDFLFVADLLEYEIRLPQKQG